MIEGSREEEGCNRSYNVRDRATYMVVVKSHLQDICSRPVELNVVGTSRATNDVRTEERIVKRR